MLRDLRPKSKDAPHRIPTEHKTCRSSQSRVWDCTRKDEADVGRKPKSIGPGVLGDKLDTHLRRTSLLSNESLQVSAAIDLDPKIARGGTARPVHPKEQAESVRPDALVDEEGIPISPLRPKNEAARALYRGTSREMPTRRCSSLRHKARNEGEEQEDGAEKPRL
ncbi:hypothetical protein BDZ90DRAFT_49423 [Jaminaea rosea]|uniref:Uncharacterized protein n=1 Tax=Jaminaea rosea TaxID=1569628 RepID=A0A316ULX0_9BASI|nr:hypothetical protein BDZ90DRAFT_49423 [Jaminaea rosea]PWN26239.1 hypothetical protein BDZ90DRAFT_49423 [Jaminaea rosea]